MNFAGEPASNQSGRLPNCAAFCADRLNAVKPSARLIPKMFFTRLIISKWAFVADAELELTGAVVVFIMLQGDAVIQTQRSQMRDVQAQAHAPVVTVIQ